jgi:preprotein translocase subunit SecA
MFQDMMDRIEDETIKFLFFMRVEFGGPVGSDDVPLPYPTDESAEEEDDDEPEGEPELVTANVQAQQREAQQSVLDLTRNIQRKKDRELANLQLAGSGDGTSRNQPVSNKGPKVGRNEACPCGSGKKYKRCCGATS